MYNKDSSKNIFFFFYQEAITHCIMRIGIEMRRFLKLDFITFLSVLLQNLSYLQQLETMTAVRDVFLKV